MTDSIVSRLGRTFDPDERREIGHRGGTIAAARARVARSLLQELSASKERTYSGLRSLSKRITWKGQTIEVLIVEQGGGAHCKNKDLAVARGEPVKLAWGFVKNDFVLRLEDNGRKRSFRFLPDAHKHWKEVK